MKYKVGDKVRLKNIKSIYGEIFRIENQNVKPVYILAYNNEKFSAYEENLELMPLTNRQWLESLSDIELAKLLDDWSVLKCNNCLYHYEENHELPCYKDCNRGRLKWLQAEHKGA